MHAYVLIKKILSVSTLRRDREINNKLGGRYLILLCKWRLDSTKPCGEHEYIS